MEKKKKINSCLLLVGVVFLLNQRVWNSLTLLISLSNPGFCSGNFWCGAGDDEYDDYDDDDVDDDDDDKEGELGVGRNRNWVSDKPERRFVTSLPSIHPSIHPSIPASINLKMFHLQSTLTRYLLPIAPLLLHTIAPSCYLRTHKISLICCYVWRYLSSEEIFSTKKLFHHLLSTFSHSILCWIVDFRLRNYLSMWEQGRRLWMVL